MMRFRDKRLDLKDHHHERRVVKKFLWMPRCFDGINTRWFETALICEQMQRCLSFVGELEYRWVEIGFAELA